MWRDISLASAILVILRKWSPPDPGPETPRPEFLERWLVQGYKWCSRSLSLDQDPAPGWIPLGEWGPRPCPLARDGETSATTTDRHTHYVKQIVGAIETPEEGRQDEWGEAAGKAFLQELGHQLTLQDKGYRWEEHSRWGTAWANTESAWLCGDTEMTAQHEVGGKPPQ